MSTRLLPLVVFIAAILGGCTFSAASISEILRRGDRADGRKVRVTGDVTNVVVLDESGLYSYEIEDGTGNIHVQSRRGPPPSPCERLRIHGRVHSVFTAMTNNAQPGRVYGQWWSGLAIDEIDRQHLGTSPTAELFGCKHR